MSLTEPEKNLLRQAAAVACDETGCPCATWKRRLADQARLHAPDVPDAVLAGLLLHVSGFTTVIALAHDLSGVQAGGIITGAAVELAALEIGDRP